MNNAGPVVLKPGTQLQKGRCPVRLAYRSTVRGGGGGTPVSFGNNAGHLPQKAT